LFDRKLYDKISRAFFIDNLASLKMFSKLFKRGNKNKKSKEFLPISTLHAVPSTKKIALSRIAIVLTVLFWISYIVSTILRQFFEGASYQFTLEAFGYVLVVTFLTFSALMYLVARQGALQRFSKHVRVPRAVIDKYFEKNRPAITVLVPSYSEESDVIRKTLLSAALQEYPKLRVVLLVDDNPNPHSQKDKERLTKTRNLASDIDSFLSSPYDRFSKALKSFEKEHKNHQNISKSGIKELAKHYIWAASWLENTAGQEKIEDHVDKFFADRVLRELAYDLRLVGEALAHSTEENANLSKTRVRQLYNRLVWIFGAEVEVFERKKYASLSHEANKAMNLNSYIGLMGGNYITEDTPTGKVLVSLKNPKNADLIVPDSEFLLTLDADSILLKDYCLRLVYFLEQPENSKVAVTQTPYSSFQGAPSPIERLAGATTDIQHILHQGMSHYGATFWVGANAVIRKKALEDIVQKEHIGGFEIKRYIQDRTVIEDTESSIDLAVHGWSLINYPEKLSYSATPPDFGSLVVQRRRWANGGLLILPKLLAQVRARKSKNEHVTRTEILLRLNYMASIAWASFGLIFLLAFPYDGRLLSPLVLLAALPYFVIMAMDLKYCGYKYMDVFKIYGFNLILLPVNLAGVLKSMQQALTGKKIPFARTPKVKNRTATEAPYLLAPLFIIGFSLFTLWRNIEGENWGNAAFAGFNAVTATWAVVAYIGVVNLFVDLFYALFNWLFPEVKVTRKEKALETKPKLDWQSVLYHGEANGIVPHTSMRDLVSFNMPSKKGASV
jgi:cellulose synthase (UDP-forming)